MDKLMDIALKSDSEKTSLDAIIYSVNRVIGTPTNKIQDVSDNQSDNLTKEEIEIKLKELSE